MLGKLLLSLWALAALSDIIASLLITVEMWSRRKKAPMSKIIAAVFAGFFLEAAISLAVLIVASAVGFKTASQAIPVLGVASLVGRTFKAAGAWTFRLSMSGVITMPEKGVPERSGEQPIEFWRREIGVIVREEIQSALEHLRVDLNLSGPHREKVTEDVAS